MLLDNNSLYVVSNDELVLIGIIVIMDDLWYIQLHNQNPFNAKTDLPVINEVLHKNHKKKQLTISNMTSKVYIRPKHAYVNFLKD